MDDFFIVSDHYVCLPSLYEEKYRETLTITFTFINGQVKMFIKNIPTVFPLQRQAGENLIDLLEEVLL